MKVRVKWPNAACSLHLKVGVERPIFSPHDFAGELTQTTTDHVPRPFFRPHQTKTGKGGLATRDYYHLDSYHLAFSLVNAHLDRYT